MEPSILGRPQLSTHTRLRPSACQALAAWGHEQGYRWDAVAAAGPARLTPLHLAAAARSGPLFKALFGEWWQHAGILACLLLVPLLLMPPQQPLLLPLHLSTQH